MKSFHRRIVACGCGVVALTAILCSLHVAVRRLPSTAERAGGITGGVGASVTSETGAADHSSGGPESASRTLGIPDSWWILGSMLTMAAAVALYLSSTSAKLRRDLTRLRNGIRQLPSHEPDVDVEDFKFKELEECARELSSIADSLRREQGRLAEDAACDPLTRLPNRRFLMTTLAQEVAAATRMGWPLSFVMVDLDHFKAVNDTYGHQVGDYVLKRAAERMAGLVRRADTLARFGGEEFAIVLPRANLEQAVKIAQELRDALRCTPHLVDQHSIQVSASFGVAEMSYCRVFHPDELVKSADAALYEAKSGGRDTVVAAPQTFDLVEENYGEDDARADLSEANSKPRVGERDTVIGAETMALMGSTFSVLQVIPDIDRVTRDTLQQITATLNCRQASFFMRDPKDDALTLVASVGAPMYEIGRQQTASDELVNWVSHLQGAEDFVRGRRVQPTVAESTGEGGPCQLVWIPLASQSELLGVVEVTDVPGEVVIGERRQSILSAICLIGATALRACVLFRKQEDRWTALTEALCHVIQAEDDYKRDHALRVSDLCVRIARYIGLTDENELRMLKTAALVHDIGKIRVPRQIRDKKGRLRSAERRIMEEHCRVGAGLLDGIPDMDRLANIVLHHHERFDGNGYPDRLAGEEIPLESKIIAVADAYDAMRSNRPYRKALSEVEAIAAIQVASGNQFDPTVVTGFMQYLEDSAARTPSEAAVS